MVLALSVLTIATIAFLVSAFTHSVGYGFVIASILHVVWFMIFGASFILPTAQVWVNYFWSAFLFSILGWALAIVLRIPALLSGAYYAKVFQDEHFKRKHTDAHTDKYPDLKPMKDMSSAGQTFGKFIIVLLLLAFGHIWYELNVDWLPKWAGGVILSVFIILAWFVFYRLFRDGENRRSVLFNSQNPNNEVSTIACHIGMITLFYSLMYWIFQLADCPHWSDNAPNVTNGGECDDFIDGQWYYYSSLIYAVLPIIDIIIVWAVSRSNKDATDVNREYQGLKQNSA